MEIKNDTFNNSDSIKNFEEENPNLNANSNNITFNRLRDLQSLIKKESALKELCKKIILFFFYF